MKIFELQRVYRKNLSLKHIFIVIFCLFTLVPLFSFAADTDDRFKECPKIDNNSERLKCFDDLAGRKTPVTETTALV